MSEANSGKQKIVTGNTYKKHRRETKFDVLDIATELKHKVSVYVMNEKRVSKKWRYFNGKPAADYARMIRDCVSMANDIFLDKDNLQHRKQLQEKALSYCNLLQFQLMDIIAECDGATEESMRSIVDLLLDLTRKIRKWIKADSDRVGTT